MKNYSYNDDLKNHKGDNNLLYYLICFIILILCIHIKSLISCFRNTCLSIYNSNTRPNMIIRQNVITNYLNNLNNINPLNQICSVCIEDFNNSPDLNCILPCGHKYHKNCIKQWLINSENLDCPCCRKQCNIPGLNNNVVNPDSISIYSLNRV